MKSLPKMTLSALALTLCHTAGAAELDVRVQNLTQGIYFTPLLVAAHDSNSELFRVATAASSELQAMAEGGAIDGLVNQVEVAGGDVLANPAQGLLAPGHSGEGTLTTSESNTYLSLVAMMLPTNDGFVGLSNWPVPSEPGTYHVYLNAHDAGTEANDEIRGGGAPGVPGMPVPPPLEELIGNGGSGVTNELSNTLVHIHPGNLGDDSASAGKSDINNSVQRWLNPVAKLTITVQ
ncbi:spondin domain-containing protein [Pseudoalteromonas ruthenica]|uniref:spondin domain-containing protein n=1 Tax=Pseudoalteromonas ruthenica TaxID=151081 RepID=UPI00110AE20E|nr:spondin domain-containing protein [Pseudoalteromonas ruthenica]TMO49812.1 hypothetical protein CWC24_01015 [Pseudoalteromonas ruthenica]TMO52408.1 hypothetical protein CWC23_02780 [Pseudoalteromonas ruthenica]